MADISSVQRGATLYSTPRLMVEVMSNNKLLFTAKRYAEAVPDRSAINRVIIKIVKFFRIFSFVLFVIFYLFIEVNFPFAAFRNFICVHNTDY